MMLGWSFIFHRKISDDKFYYQCFQNLYFIQKPLLIFFACWTFQNQLHSSDGTTFLVNRLTDFTKCPFFLNKKVVNLIYMNFRIPFPKGGVRRLYTSLMLPHFSLMRSVELTINWSWTLPRSATPPGIRWPPVAHQTKPTTKMKMELLIALVKIVFRISFSYGVVLLFQVEFNPLLWSNFAKIIFLIMVVLLLTQE